MFEGRFVCRHCGVKVECVARAFNSAISYIESKHFFSTMKCEEIDGVVVFNSEGSNVTMATMSIRKSRREWLMENRWSEK